MQLAAGTMRRYTLLVAAINAGLPTANAAVATVTATLPNAFSAAELAAGVGGIAVPLANTGGLSVGPVALTAANTAVFKVFNPSNAAINAVNASFALFMFVASGATSGAATAVVS